MTNSLLIEPAAAEDLCLDSFDDPYSGLLKSGPYIVADPGTFLSEKDFDKWAEIATLSPNQFMQYGDGHDGMIRSARINGYPVTGFTVFADYDEFVDESGRRYEIKQLQITEFYELQILAVIPTTLLDELGFDYPAGHVFEVTEENVEKEYNQVYYSTRTHRMFVGNKIEIYTGELDDALAEIDAENERDEELYAEIWADLE